MQLPENQQADAENEKLVPSAEELALITMGKKEIPPLPDGEKISTLPIGKTLDEKTLQNFLHTLYKDLDDGINLRSYKELGENNTTQLELERLRQELGGASMDQKEDAAHRLAYYHYLPLRVVQNAQNFCTYTRARAAYEQKGYALNSDELHILETAAIEHANTLAGHLRNRVAVGNYVVLQYRSEKGDVAAKNALPQALSYVPERYRGMMQTVEGRSRAANEHEATLRTLLSGGKDEILPVEALLMQFYSDLLEENVRKESALAKGDTSAIKRLLQERGEMKKESRTFHLSQGLRSIEALRIVTLRGAFGQLYKGPADEKPGNIGGAQEMGEYLDLEEQNIRGDFAEYIHLMREEVLKDDLPGMKAEELWNREGRLLFLKISRRIAQLRALPKYMISKWLGDKHVEGLLGDLNEEFGLPRDFNHNDPNEWNREDVRKNMTTITKKMQGTAEALRNHNVAIMRGLELFQNELSLIEEIKRARNVENLNFLLSLTPDWDAIEGLPLNEETIKKMSGNDRALLALCLMIFDRLEEQWRNHNAELAALDSDVAEILETHQGARREWGAGGVFPWLLVAILTGVGADALFNRARITRFSTRITYRASRSAYQGVRNTYQRYRASKNTPPKSGSTPEQPSTRQTPPQNSRWRSGRLRWGRNSPQAAPKAKPAGTGQKPPTAVRQTAPSVKPNSIPRGSAAPREASPGAKGAGRGLLLYALWKVGEAQLASWAMEPLPEDYRVHAAVEFLEQRGDRKVLRFAEEMKSLQERQKLISMRGTIEGILERLTSTPFPDPIADDAILLKEWGEALVEDIVDLDEELYNFFPVTDYFFHSPGVREGVGVSTEINDARKRGMEYVNSKAPDLHAISKFMTQKPGTMTEALLSKTAKGEPKSPHPAIAELMQSILKDAQKTPFERLKEECDAFQREAATVMEFVE